MSANRPILDSLRILPEDNELLSNKVGNNGDVFLDRTTKTLRIFDGQTTGGISLAKNDLSNVSSSDFNSKLVSADIATVEYAVTVVGPVSPDTGNKYQIDGVYKPELNLVKGYIYVFDQTDPTNVYYPNANGTTANPHPLNFSADNLNGIQGGGTSYTTNVTYLLDGTSVTQAVYNSSSFNTATTRQVKITITSSTPATLYYWCWNHSGMGNTLSSADPGTGSGTGDRLINGSYHVVLNADGTVLLPEGGKLGNVQDVNNGGMDLYAPDTLDYVQLNYNNDAYAFIEKSATDSNFGQFVLDMGSGNDWVFDGANGVTAFPSFTFPGTSGTVGQGLFSDGAGNLIWSLPPYVFRTVAVSGQSDIVADSNTDTLTVAAGSGIQVTTNSGTDTLTIANTQTNFGTIQVSGQTDAVATTGNDTLTIVGSGINITTSDNTITFTSTSSVTTAFTNIAIAGQTTVSSDLPADTLTLVAGPNIGITTNAETDTITITATTGGSASINAITLNDPIRIETTAAHGFVNAQSVTFSDVVGTTELNGNSYYAKIITSTTFDLYSDVGLSTTVDGTAGFSAYTSGGVATGASGSGNGGVSTGTFDHLAYYAATGNILSEATGLLWDGTTLLLNGSTVQTEANRKPIQIYVAADDSTIRTIGEDESIKFIGAGGITTSSDAEGNITITGSDTTLAFQTISVSGQSDVVADSSGDTLTIAAGTGITVTTDAGTDTITITNSSPNVTQNAFTTIAVVGKDSLVADSATDTLNITPGTNITFDTNAATDTLTINATNQYFSTLQETGTFFYAGSGLTIDQIALPAITRLEVTNNGQIYEINNQYSGNNPTIYAISGTTIAFLLNVNGHPFAIQTGAGVNYNTGLIHVDFTGTVVTGSSAQGKTIGTLYWQVPFGISGTYRYQCLSHPAMQGNIIIKDISTI